MKDVKGFTLIELMVTIAVLAIVMSWAVPSFSNLLQDHRISALSMELQGALQLARSESVRRNEDVEVCRTNVDADACSSGTGWEAGWLVIADEEVLKVWDPVQGVSITGPTDGIVFRSNGMVTTAGNFTVTHYECKGEQKRVVRVNKVGSTTIAKEACL